MFKNNACYKIFLYLLKSLCYFVCKCFTSCCCNRMLQVLLIVLEFWTVLKSIVKKLGSVAAYTKVEWHATMCIVLNCLNVSTFQFYSNQKHKQMSICLLSPCLTFILLHKFWYRCSPILISFWSIG